MVYLGMGPGACKISRPLDEAHTFSILGGIDIGGARSGWLPGRFNARQPVTRSLLGSGSDQVLTCFVRTKSVELLILNLNFDHTESRRARPL